jgi:hypothetical protein
MSVRSGKLPFRGSEDEFLTIGVRTNMRRYTRLSNGFSRKLENHAAASMVTAKPAMRGRLKTGHVEWPKTGVVLPCRTEFGKAGFGCAVTC